MNIEINLLEEKDYPKAIKLYEEVFNKKQITPFKLNETSAYIIAAKLGDEIVGLAQLDIITDLFKGIKYGYINSVCSSPNHRKKGIGNMLIEKTTEIAKENKCSFIELTSSDSKKDAHRLYFRNGYKIRETNVFKKDLL